MKTAVAVTFCLLFMPCPMLLSQQADGIRADDVKNSPALKIAPRSAEEWWRNRHREKLMAKDEMKQVDIVMIGDSITHSWEKTGKATWDKYYGERNALNLGFSGDRTEHVIWRLQNGEVEGIEPRLVVLMIGTNNTGHRQDPAEHTAAGIDMILNELSERLPEAKILLLGIFPRANHPSNGQRQLNDAINELIKEYEDKVGIWYLNINDKFLEADGTLSKEIMPDYLHPNERGYQIWAEAMEPMVKKLLEYQ